ncbi:MAG: DUF721 domain-containing protein [bacterium]|nr:DUF721 domain-containing protein [bacterium]
MNEKQIFQMGLKPQADLREAPEPTRVGDGIQRVIARLGIETQYQEQRVLAIWPEVVGEVIAKEARADAIRNGALFVSVPHDTWRHRLMFELESFRDRLNKAVGGEVVRFIRLSK